MTYWIPVSPYGGPAPWLGSAWRDLAEARLAAFAPDWKARGWTLRSYTLTPSS